MFSFTKVFSVLSVPAVVGTVTALGHQAINTANELTNSPLRDKIKGQIAATVYSLDIFVCGGSLLETAMSLKLLYQHQELSACDYVAAFSNVLVQIGLSWHPIERMINVYNGGEKNTAIAAIETGLAKTSSSLFKLYVERRVAKDDNLLEEEVQLHHQRVAEP